MISSSHRLRQNWPYSPDGQSPRSSRGLTTLEWLLIVAAVAGLAALAVVLVQNVVDDTAEQITGSSARITAALVAADAITGDDETDADKRSACSRLNITYSDAFQESPGRTSHWTDKDIVNENDGGVCAIVTEAVAKAITGNASKASDCNNMDTGNDAVPAADRGGKGIEHVTDIDSVSAGNQPDCVFTP